MKNIEKYIKIYRDGLLKNTMPFWINHGIDYNYGGFKMALDRSGRVLDTDKGMWQTSRFTWMLGTLYNEVEKRQEWLDLAVHGINFIEKYGFDTDGRMFFQVTRDGKPIRRRRYVFTETFAATAFAAVAKATGDSKYARKAEELYDIIIKYTNNPELEPAKFTDTRPLKGMAMPMTLISTAQEMRKNLGEEKYTGYIQSYINEIQSDFMNEEFKVVLETVGPNGEFSDHFDGRLLCPGHAIELAWFILQEAKLMNNPEYLKTGIKILDWMWEVGWDKEYGGIIYFRDAKGFPVQEYWQDMKFWWPQNETIIATLLAYQLTGDKKYEKWHKDIHDWTYKYFPDKEYGEWFGYLHRDGRVSTTLKGNMWKGPFHIPRMELYSWKILEEIQANKG